MATITAAQAGNWSDTATWTGGVVPGDGDIADLNGFDVTMDIATIPASGTLLGITAAGSAGTLVIGGVAGANVINATTLTAGTKGTTGTFPFSETTCDSLTINGNIVGCAVGGTNPCCVVKTSTKPLTINGNITGGDVAGSTGLVLSQGAGAVVIIGNVVGGSNTNAYGVSSTTSTDVTITGNVTGGSGQTAHGVSMGGVAAPTLSLNGASAGAPAIITGGTGQAAFGVSRLVGSGGFNVSFTHVNLVNGTGGIAYAGPPPTWTPIAANTWAFSGFNFAKEVLATDLALGVVNGTVTGTLVADYTVNGIVCS